MQSINRFALNRNWQDVPPTPKVAVRVRSPCSLVRSPPSGRDAFLVTDTSTSRESTCSDSRAACFLTLGIAQRFMPSGDICIAPRGSKRLTRPSRTCPPDKPLGVIAISSHYCARTYNDAWMSYSIDLTTHSRKCSSRGLVKTINSFTQYSRNVHL